MTRLNSLTQEEREALKAEMRAEEAAAQQVQDEKEKKEGVWVYTNALNGILLIPDLGIASPGGSFEAESFGPFETKDLAEIYEPEELRKSKYLRMLARESDGRLVKGRVPRERLQVKDHPLAILARNNPNGSFTDPTSAQRKGDFGENMYDQKLRELHDREHDEDMETRKQ